MNLLRKSEERGKGEYGWLSARYSFSFASYYDALFTGFSDLRVINQDVIDPGMGFDTHPHNNMEIVTYIIDGTLEHKDSLGNSGRIAAGEIQRMTAGSGIRHSEYNPDPNQSAHLLQIWIDTNQKNLRPDWQQKEIKSVSGFNLIVSETGEADSLNINQDIKIYSGNYSEGFELQHKVSAGRKFWIQLISGSLEVNRQELSAGDGIGISEINELAISSNQNAHFLLFDLR
ncbi:MAG: pirin family protein [Halobacteriovoraceae bacterium]|jgi:quercetin 2,3-dioxygenase|nr:pirin family protein [Halobacteriovoraceae bacterium]MBT5094942.1 pirin family protein [Halobacteriovoraceae bacterium]